MVKILLDACVPQWLRHKIKDHQVETAFFAQLDQIPDNQLLDRIEGKYDVLITLDRNITFQQYLTNRSISILVLRVPEQTPECFRALIAPINSALATIAKGEVRELG